MKERIIGAAILVVVAILIVPVFLDGAPGQHDVISTSVPLPGQSEQKVQTVVLDRDRTDPVPAASGAADAAKTQAPQQAQTPAPQQVVEEQVLEEQVLGEQVLEEKVVEENNVKPIVTPVPEMKIEVEQKPNPAETGEAKKTVAPSIGRSPTGMWAVQLGSFSNQQNADKLASDLRKQGFAAFLSQLSTESGELHRVRIGPQKDRESAAAMAARLSKAGHKGQVVPHP